MNPTAFLDIAGCGFIWRTRASIFLSLWFISIRIWNWELGLRSIVRRKALRYQGGAQHKEFEGLFKQEFLKVHGLGYEWSPWQRKQRRCTISIVFTRDMFLAVE